MSDRKEEDKTFSKNNPQWNVKLGCPFKELTEALGGRLKKDWSCDICIVNPMFCLAHQIKQHKKDTSP